MQVHAAVVSLLKSSAPPPPWLWAVWALMACFAVSIVVLARRADRRRREAIEHAAMEIGFSVQSAVLPRSEEELKQFTLGARPSRRFRNVLLGYAAGAEALLFDFQYRQGKHVSSQTVAAFRWTQAALPRFQLGPESVLHRIAETFGFQDINLEAHPEFSRRYLLRGRDEAAIRGHFTPNVAAFFEQLPEEQNWSVEAGGRWVIVYRPGREVDAEQVPAFLQQTSAVAAKLYRETAMSAFGRA